MGLGSTDPWGGLRRCFPGTQAVLRVGWGGDIQTADLRRSLRYGICFCHAMQSTNSPVLERRRGSSGPHAGSRRRERVLYFDIDGTIVHQTFGPPKAAFANGGFEALLREGELDRIVCVSDAVSMGRALEAAGQISSVGRYVFKQCRGAFRDWRWFARNIEFVSDPSNRARDIDVASDWLLIDDWADRYLMRGRSRALLRSARRGQRVFRPEPDSDGWELRAWLRERLAAQARPMSTRRRRVRRRTPQLPTGASVSVAAPALAS